MKQMKIMTIVLLLGTTLLFGESTTPTMVLVEGGTFDMGSNNGENNETPVHEVTVSSFYMGATEVTQEQYVEVAGANPSSHQPRRGGENLPVENVSWYNAVQFCNALSTKENFISYYIIVGNTVTIPNVDGKGYRLPTEAEWEYAAGGGVVNRTKYAGTNDESGLEDYAYCDGWSHTQSVGGMKANALGLYDMTGNVSEWCWDRYGSYPSDTQTNPMGSDEGSYRVIRGGSYSSDPAEGRVAYRYYNSASNSNGYRGFRIVRSAQ